MLLTNLKASRSAVSILLREEVHYNLITIVRYEIYGQGPSFPTRLQAAMVPPLLTVEDSSATAKPALHCSNHRSERCYWKRGRWWTWGSLKRFGPRHCTAWRRRLNSDERFQHLRLQNSPDTPMTPYWEHGEALWLIPSVGAVVMLDLYRGGPFCTLWPAALALWRRSELTIPSVWSGVL